MSTREPERLLGRGDPRRRAGRASRCCSARGAPAATGTWSTPFGEHSDGGRRGQPGRPSAGLSASERYVRRDTRPALTPSLWRRRRPLACGSSARCTDGARLYGTVEVCAPARPRHHPRRPGLVPIHRRRGPGPVRGQGQVACAAGCRNYFADPATLAPRTAQMVALADHVEWIQVANEVEAIILEYALIKRHRPRFNIRLIDDKSYPVAGGDPRRRVAPGGGGAGPAPARASATSGPTPTSGPSATPSTCCCAPSRCGPARTASSTATSSWASPACCSTSSGARARASAPSTTSATTPWWPI